MNESGKELEYYERDLEIQERFVEINVDQRLLTKWHCLAKVLVLGKGAEKPEKLCPFDKPGGGGSKKERKKGKPLFWKSTFSVSM